MTSSANWRPEGLNDLKRICVHPICLDLGINASNTLLNKVLAGEGEEATAVFGVLDGPKTVQNEGHSGSVGALLHLPSACFFEPTCAKI